MTNTAEEARAIIRQHRLDAVEQLAHELRNTALHARHILARDVETPAGERDRWERLLCDLAFVGTRAPTPRELLEGVERLRPAIGEPGPGASQSVRRVHDDLEAAADRLAFALHELEGGKR